MTATENKINHIVAITNGSDIYFPKKLMARRDLADDTKLLFAVAMTDHCNMTVSEFSDFLITHVSEQVKQRGLRESLKDLQDSSMKYSVKNGGQTNERKTEHGI